MKLSFGISVNLELAKDLSENTDMSERLQNLQVLTDGVCVCVFLKKTLHHNLLLQ